MARKEAPIPPIEFTPAGTTEEEQEEILEIVTPSPGFGDTARLLVEAIRRESFTTVMDFSQQQVTLRFLIDGIWHAGETMDRESGDFLLATLKKLAGLDFRERRMRQEGRFGSFYKKVKQKIRVVSQGTKTGERVAIYLDWKKPPVETVEDLGMRTSMVTQLTPILQDDKTGLVLVSAIPGEGYTSAWRGILDTCDRLTRDYYVIEEKTEVEPEVINILSIVFDRSLGENAMSPMEQLLLKQPNVLAFPELPDTDLINSVVDLSIDQDLPVFVRGPGKHAVDALLRLISKKPDVEKLAHRLSVVVTMRLIRKLCNTCKISYPPHPSLMQKLGLPPGRIAQMFRPTVFQPGAVDENDREIQPCPKCQGIGYKGRTGIFEMLKINDELRAAIVAGPRMDRLMAIAQKSGHVSLQQEGIVLVARGITSIEELQRVLKA